MPANPNLATVRGSERIPLPGTRAVGPVPKDERFEVTVRVRRKTPLQSLAADGFHADQLPAKRHYLTREQYAASHGSDPADLAKVEAFARAHGLVVVETSAARRSVFLSGTAADFATAFGTTIEQYEHEGGTYRGRTGPLTVPAELADIVEGVFGIDDRPVAKPHFQRKSNASTGNPIPRRRWLLHATRTGETLQLPDRAWTARGSVSPSSSSVVDIVPPTSRPTSRNSACQFRKLRQYGSMAGRTYPTTADSADGEVMLDIEVAAAVAPKALIAVYFAPNTDKGFLDAITMAIHDTTSTSRR